MVNYQPAKMLPRGAVLYAKGTNGISWKESNPQNATGVAELQFPCGGWCPEGRRAEDGVIPEHYPVTVPVLRNNSRRASPVRFWTPDQVPAGRAANEYS